MENKGQKYITRALWGARPPAWINSVPTDEIWYLSVFLKPFPKIQFSPKRYKNNGYFIRRHLYIYYTTTLNPLQIQMFQTNKLYWKNTRFMFVKLSENQAVYKTM
jgi:hypothetical protein